MDNSKIVHILSDSPITKKYIEFMNIAFPSNHMFVNLTTTAKYLDMSKTINFNIKSLSGLFSFVKLINKKEIIVIHGLFDVKFILLLALQPWLLSKCYWIIWGGDLYAFTKKRDTLKSKAFELTRKYVIKRIGHYVTYIKGDYALAEKWYGSEGKYHECFMYPSNLYKEYAIKEKERSTINIQVGNSADPSNNHLDVFKKLTKYKDENINIFVPLSYGEKKYANDIILKGKEIFGNKFKPITEFMPFDKYLEFLGDIDIAIFAHKRQQAMGNTITLLGLEKKVYMRSDITPWELFKDIKVKVFDIENIDLELFSQEEKQSNQKKIKEYFSEENYLKQLKQLFEAN